MYSIWCDLSKLVVWKINFSPGAQISWRLMQKWPRNKKKVRKKSKNGQNPFFSKRAKDFELLKQVLESSHQTVFQYFSTYWDINLVSKCLPVHCVMIVHRWLNLNTFYYDSKFNLNADLSNWFHARTWPIETNHEIPGLIFLMIIRHKTWTRQRLLKPVAAFWFCIYGASK